MGATGLASRRLARESSAPAYVRALPEAARVVAVPARNQPPVAPPAAAPEPVPVIALDPPAQADGEIPRDVLERVRAASPDVLVVLGAQVHDGLPGRNMRQRMWTALRLREALPNHPRLLLTGGHGEARAMRGFFLAHGVAARDLILETRSRTTDQNARFSMRILERDAQRYRVALLVTTAVRMRHRLDDHARRALESFAYFAHRVRLAAVSINADPSIAPRMYVAGDREHRSQS
jgi:hypothetical protein